MMDVWTALQAAQTNLAAFCAVVCGAHLLFGDVAWPYISRQLPDSLPPKAAPLVVLSARDKAVLFMNRVLTSLLVYHTLQLACSSYFDQTDLLSAADSLHAVAMGKQFAIWLLMYFPATILVFDAVYAPYHRFLLHAQWLFPWIHKHHHGQHCCFRGNVDAINAHPVEYLIGGYIHLFSASVTASVAQTLFTYTPHAMFLGLQLIVCGLMSTLNHTRVDVRIPYVYNVWWHDLHHRVPASNYGQYTMFWDWVFGWYKPESTATTERGNKTRDEWVEHEQKLMARVSAALARVGSRPPQSGPSATGAPRSVSSRGRKKDRDASSNARAP